MSNDEIDLNAAPEELNEDELDAINEFKKDGLWEIEDGVDYIVQENEQYLKSDWTASRFLVARDWNVAKARAMFKEHLRCRKQMNISSIIDDFSVTEEEAEAVRKYCPQFWLGTDDQGRPIYVQSFTKLNGKKLFEGISEERIIEAQCFSCETLIRDVLPACSKAAGKPIRRTASLIDFKSVSYSQLFTAKRFAQKFLGFQEANYPDYLGCSYVINAPTSLAIVWNLASKILPAATVAKVQILGTDYHEKLRIPKEHLAEEYGGPLSDEWQHPGAPDLNAILLISPTPKPRVRRSTDSASTLSNTSASSISSASFVSAST